MAVARARLRATLRPVERVAYGGVLAAVAAAAGFALAGIPNVELVTLIVCLSGALYGPLLGACVGGLAEAVFSLGNPLGPAPLPLLVGQVLGMAMAGAMGGALGALPWPRRRAMRLALCGAAGVLATLIFHVATDGAYAAIARLTWAYMLAGVPFYLVHVASNTVLFALAVPAVVEAVHARFSGAPARRER